MFAKTKTERLIVGMTLLIFLSVLIRTAWVCDDAYITFRTVDNWIHGFGLTWNPPERVQGYTHPLWFLLFSLFYRFTHEAYFTAISLSLLLSLCTATIILTNLAHNRRAVLLLCFVMVLSRAYVDFSTSGLENPLSHLLLVLFFVTYLKPPTLRHNGRLSWIGCLGMLSRLDHALIYLPPLMLRAWQDRSKKNILAMLSGMLPLFAWEIFSIIYYGFPFPNTAYAKLHHGIPWYDLLEQGGYYFQNSLRQDPISLFSIAFATGLTLYRKRRQLYPFLAGLCLYLLYILKIGGDFMSGRFFTQLFLLAILLLSQEAWEEYPLYLTASFFLLFAGLISPYPTITANQQYGFNRSDIVAPHGIADERAYYYLTTGLLRQPGHPVHPFHDWGLQGAEARQNNAKLIDAITIGFRGYFAGPRIHLVDYFALTDPFLARLPALVSDASQTYGAWGTHSQRWRIGHFLRTGPDGYRESLLSGTNQLKDPKLALLFDKIQLLIHGDLWNADRWRAIYEFNTGRLENLVDFETYHYPEHLEVDLKDYNTPKSSGTDWDHPGNLILSYSGVIVRLGNLVHAKQVELSLDHNDDYRLLYFSHGKEIGHRDIQADHEGPGLQNYLVKTPWYIRAQGFDLLRVLPLSGDNKYSLGHLRLLP